jgi:hypothetical protein
VADVYRGRRLHKYVVYGKARRHPLSATCAMVVAAVVEDQAPKAITIYSSWLFLFIS